VGTASDANAVQWVQNGSNDQEWQLIAVGADYELPNRDSGLALSVSSALTSDGPQVLQEPYAGASLQSWAMAQVSS
jgi:hypothetical protein